MSKVKGGGNTKNVKDSPGQRLGVKIYGGQQAKTGQVIVRQVGQTKVAGDGTFMSRNYTIHAAKDGVVQYSVIQSRDFTGRNRRRTRVSVV